MTGNYDHKRHQQIIFRSTPFSFQNVPTITSPVSLSRCYCQSGKFLPSHRPTVRSCTPALFQSLRRNFFRVNVLWEWAVVLTQKNTPRSQILPNLTNFCIFAL